MNVCSTHGSVCGQVISPFLAVVSISRVPAIVTDARALREFPYALHQVLLIVKGIEKGQKHR